MTWNIDVTIMYLITIPDFRRILFSFSYLILYGDFLEFSFVAAQFNRCSL